jgi:hypothetical protein
LTRSNHQPAFVGVLSARNRLLDRDEPVGDLPGTAQGFYHQQGVDLPGEPGGAAFVEASAQQPQSGVEMLTLILFGFVLVVVATRRFVRTERLLDDQEAHLTGGSRAEVLLSAALALFVAGWSIYLALG